MPDSVEAALRRLSQPRTPADVTHGLAALPEPDDAGRLPALLAAYGYLDAAPTKRDRSAQTRVAILKRIRRAGLSAPMDLLLTATDRYEDLQPGLEVAAPLRAAALVLLNDQDDRLATFAAVRLLNDPRREPMSGEPAVTAARILAAQDQLAPLYAYLRRPEPGQEEILQTALLALRDAPEPILFEAVAIGLSDPRESVVGAALETMLSVPGERFRDQIAHLLTHDRRPALIEFGALTIAANRIPWQIALLEALVEAATPAWRRDHLSHALRMIAGEA